MRICTECMETQRHGLRGRPEVQVPMYPITRDRIWRCDLLHEEPMSESEAMEMIGAQRLIP